VEASLEVEASLAVEALEASLEVEVVCAETLFHALEQC